MHLADIEAVIEKRGTSLREILHLHGYSEHIFASCLRSPHRKVERLLSEFLGIPLHVLFPERWDANGKRLIRPGRPCRESIHTKADDNVNRKRSRGWS